MRSKSMVNPILILILVVTGCSSMRRGEIPTSIDDGSGGIPKGGWVQYMCSEGVPYFVIICPLDLANRTRSGGEYKIDSIEAYYNCYIDLIDGDYSLEYQVYKNGRKVVFNGETFYLDEGSIFLLRRDFSVAQTPFHYAGDEGQLMEDARLMGIYNGMER